MRKTFFILLIFIVLFSCLGFAQENGDLREKVNTVYTIPIKGDIDPGMSTFVEKHVGKAEKSEADLIIFEIDTYGGLVQDGTKIKDIIFKTELPTVTYIANRAWSAGALIALAGEKMAMVEGSSIGAAETRPNEEKYISALRKEFSATAEARNRDGEVAAAMVDKEISIEGVIRGNKLLTLTAKEAEKNNITEHVVSNFQELLSVIGAEDSDIVVAEKTLTEKMAGVVTTPIFSTLLLTIGFIALLFEALIPGWGVGGTIGLLSLGLFFSSFIISGYAHWGLILLFVVGIILIGLEIFVVPGFGFTGIGGLIAIFTSLFFFFPNPEMALGVLASVSLISIIAAIIMFKYFGASKFWKNISLEESQTKDVGYTAHIDKKELLGKEGETISNLRPAGTAEIEGQRIDVVSEGGYIKKGKQVKIVNVAGSRIVVKKITEEE